MIKVFLVEDEFVVREGIKNNIDWVGHGYEFCGEASDGELAFPMIEKLRPDVVITDIRMPFMDGLELSRLIKKEFPWMEIIILSGFEEFEYAKEAIKIGVAQYLTKPIKGDDLIREVDILAGKIEESRKEREVREKYRQEMEENTRKDRFDLFNDLVTGEKSLPELMELAEKLSIDLTAIHYNIILLTMQSENHTQGEYSTSSVEVEARLNEWNREHSFVLFDRNLEGKALLFEADNEEELKENQNAFIARFETLIKGYPKLRYFGGIGEPVNRLRRLPECFESANHAYAHRYFVNESRFMQLTPGAVNTVKKDAFDLTTVDPRQFDKNRIGNFLKLGSRDEVSFFMDEFVKDMGKKSLESMMLRQYIAMDTYFTVVSFLEELEYERDLIDAPDIPGDTLKNAANTVKYMTDIISVAVERRERKTSSRYGEVVDEVLRYIEEHYSEEELSLNSLASHVNISPNHLSMIFSQQTGQTFIKYLTDYRMNKAKEMLKCSGKRGSEIALEVGYKDPHYFSYIFKKTQGMTPTQYRGGRNAEDEE